MDQGERNTAHRGITCSPINGGLRGSRAVDADYEPRTLDRSGHAADVRAIGACDVRAVGPHPRGHWTPPPRVLGRTSETQNRDKSTARTVPWPLHRRPD